MKNRDGQKKSAVSNFVKSSFSVPYPLLKDFDEEAERHGYTRSEALRQAMRRLLETWTGRRY